MRSATPAQPPPAEPATQAELHLQIESAAETGSPPSSSSTPDLGLPNYAPGWSWRTGPAPKSLPDAASQRPADSVHESWDPSRRKSAEAMLGAVPVRKT